MIKMMSLVVVLCSALLITETYADRTFTLKCPENQALSGFYSLQYDFFFDDPDTICYDFGKSICRPKEFDLGDNKNQTMLKASCGSGELDSYPTSITADPAVFYAKDPLCYQELRYDDPARSICRPKEFDLGDNKDKTILKASCGSGVIASIKITVDSAGIPYRLRVLCCPPAEGILSDKTYTVESFVYRKLSCKKDDFRAVMQEFTLTLDKGNNVVAYATCVDLK